MYRVLLACLIGVAAGTGVYRVNRQDFTSNARLASQQAPPQNGVYQVHRQDFTDGVEAPFSGTGYVYEVPYGRYYNNRFQVPGVGQQPSTAAPLPKLFVPAQPYPNYNRVMSPSQWEQQNAWNQMQSGYAPPAWNQPNPWQYNPNPWNAPPTYYVNPAPAQPVYPTPQPSGVFMPVQPSQPATAPPPLLPSTPTTTVRVNSLFDELTTTEYSDQALPAIPDPDNPIDEQPLPALTGFSDGVSSVANDTYVYISDEQRDLLYPTPDVDSEVLSEDGKLEKAVPIRRSTSS